MYSEGTPCEKIKERSDHVSIPMAKRRRARRRRKILKGNVDEGLALLTLAGADLVSVAFDETVLDRAWIPSMEATWMLRNLTVGEGPILVGIAHGDYTAAEIEEFVENAGSWSEGDMINREIAQRKIRIVGAFSGLGTIDTTFVDEVLNDGRPIKTKLRMILNQGETLQVWAYNQSGATLTTGASVLMNGHVWIIPS